MILHNKYFVAFRRESGEVLKVGKVIEQVHALNFAILEYNVTGDYEVGILTLFDLDPDYKDLHFYDTKQGISQCLEKLGVIGQTETKKREFLLTDFLPTTPQLTAKSEGSA